MFPMKCCWMFLHVNEALSIVLLLSNSCYLNISFFIPISTVQFKKKKQTNADCSCLMPLSSCSIKQGSRSALTSAQWSSAGWWTTWTRSIRPSCPTGPCSAPWTPGWFGWAKTCLPQHFMWCSWRADWFCEKLEKLCLCRVWQGASQAGSTAQTWPTPAEPCCSTFTLWTGTPSFASRTAVCHSSAILLNCLLFRKDPWTIRP